MKQFVILFITALCFISNANGQNYTDHLQKKTDGTGTVTINQSKEIDELVNRTPVSTKESATTTGKKITGPKTNTQPKEKEPDKKAQATHDTKKISHEPQTGHDSAVTKQAEKQQPKHQEKTTTTETDEDDEFDIPTVDMRKKVMRQSYKTNGYRVQAFAGGNSRADRQKAENIGSSIKLKYPDQPIYVHFYSPRWICRVGNYRTYDEAQLMLKRIHAMGYKQACIVKGKISVQR